MMSTLTSIFGDAKSMMFLLFAIGAIAGVVMMNNLTKVVHMVVSVALTFLSLAGVYILLEAEFVAMVQVLVYGGAMTILMIFGIMMTKHDAVETEEAKTTPQEYLAMTGATVLFAILFYAIQKASFASQPFDPGTDNTKAIGIQLFNVHVIPFELISVLLTVAFIGAIVLAKKESE